MTPGSHERRHARLAWRLGTPLVVLACGALFVVSGANSDGTDLRPGGYTDLATLVASESERVEDLHHRLAELQADVARLSEDEGGRRAEKLQQRIERLDDPAGLEARSGEGVTVVLEDAPREVVDSTERNRNLLVVHQQDIQAVVNAMWKGGARAITIQGQRVISTTGIKCSGNVVQLHGVAYSQPYVISAVGDQEELMTAISNDDYLQAYRSDAKTPDINIGWSVELEEEIEAPAYEGLLDVSYAEPIA